MRSSFAGPHSSHAKTKGVGADPGKFVAIGNSSGEFRRISNASGPQASAGSYTPTQDIGKQVAAGGTGEYRRIVNASGPQASVGQYRATLDPGRQTASSVAGSPSDFYSTQAGTTEGNVDPIKMLLGHNYNVNVLTSSGNLPLYQSPSSGQFSDVQYFSKGDLTPINDPPKYSPLKSSDPSPYIPSNSSNPPLFSETPQFREIFQSSEIPRFSETPQFSEISQLSATPQFDETSRPTIYAEVIGSDLSDGITSATRVLRFHSQDTVNDVLLKDSDQRSAPPPHNDAPISIQRVATPETPGENREISSHSTDCPICISHRELNSEIAELRKVVVALETDLARMIAGYPVK